MARRGGSQAGVNQPGETMDVTPCAVRTEAPMAGQNITLIAAERRTLAAFWFLRGAV